MLRQLGGALIVCLAAMPAIAGARGFQPDSKCEGLVPEGALRTAVGIEIPLAEHERPKPYITAVRATAWFRSQDRVVVIEHVATPSFITEEWRDATLFWSDAVGEKFTHTLDTKARLANVFDGDPGAEVLVEIELKDRVPGAVVAKIRAEPLQQYEPVYGVAYRHYEYPSFLAYGQDDTRPALIVATGRVTYPKPSEEASDDSQPLPPYIPLEMADGNYRNAFGHGASGAPVFDCQGRVVASAVILIARCMDVGITQMEVTPPWGYANNFATGTSHLARVRNTDPPNMVLPLNAVATGDGSCGRRVTYHGETHDETLTRLQDALTDAIKKNIDGRAGLREVEEAWRELNAFTTQGSENSQPPAELPPLVSPFE